MTRVDSCEWSCGPERVLRDRSQVMRSWERPRVLRNPGHTRAGLQRTLLYFRHHSQSAQSAGCGQSVLTCGPIGPLSMLTPYAQVGLGL